MVFRLVRRGRMDLQLPVEHIELRQMVFFQEKDWNPGFYFQAIKRSSRRWYPVWLDGAKWMSCGF